MAKRPTKEEANTPLTRQDILGINSRMDDVMAMAREAQQRRTQSVDPRTYGEQYGSMVSQPGNLQRIQEARPEEIADLVRRRKEGAEGLTAPQYAVAREQMMSQQGAAEQQAQRQLARQQAIAGIRGGAATKQSGRLAQQLAQQRAQQEQGLFMADVGEKQKGLSAYEQTLGSAVQGEQARQLFNIEQQQREQLARQARELTIAQLSQAQALGERQAQAAEYYAEQMGKAPDGGGGGGLCCFIFLEARYGNGTMDSVVRRYRDEHMTDQNRRGYYKASEFLVPLMRKYKPVKWAVRLMMTDPMVAYGRAYYGTGSKLGYIFKPIADFWLKTFAYLGGNHPFIRENGEVV